MDKKLHKAKSSDDAAIIIKDREGTKYTLPLERSLLPSVLDFKPAQSTRSQVKRRFSMHNPVDISKLSLWDKPGSTVFKPPIGLAPRATARHAETATAEKKPLTAFGKFFSETAVIIKQHNPTCSYEDVTRSATALWNSLDAGEKQRYLKASEEEHAHFYKQKLEQQFQLKQTYVPEIPKFNVKKPNAVCAELDTVYISDEEDKTDEPNVNAEINNALEAIRQKRNKTATPAQLLLQKAELELFGEKSSDEESGEEFVSEMNMTAAALDLMSTDIPIKKNPKEMLSDASAAEKCIREGCNKRAVVSRDWDEEYCSTECCVKHCQAEFGKWLVTNK